MSYNDNTKLKKGINSPLVTRDDDDEGGGDDDDDVDGPAGSSPIEEPVHALPGERAHVFRTTSLDVAQSRKGS